MSSFFLFTPAALGFLTVSSAVTMSAPFLLGKVIDTIYTTGTDTEAMTASLTSLCVMLTGVFLCGAAANAARVYLMQLSGETRRQTHSHEMVPKKQYMIIFLLTHNLINQLIVSVQLCFPH